jgi:hypothetical protein
MVKTMSKRIEPDGSDYGTAEARRQSFFIVEQPNPEDRSTKRIRVEDTIDWYVRRSYLTAIQGDALRKWQQDAYLAGLQPACIGGYQQSVRGGQSELSDLRLAAQARRGNAIRFAGKLGPYAAKLADAVAVDGKAAGRWWIETVGGPANDALVMLEKLANGLARHYSLVR